MNRKLIKAIISKKINEWAKSVEPFCTKTADVIRTETIVMGGAICSLLDNDKPNDFDVYFRTREGAYVVAKYYLAQFKVLQEAKQKEKGGVGIPMWLENAENPTGLKAFIKSAGVMDTRTEKAYQYFENHSAEVVQQYFGTSNENAAAVTDLDLNAAQKSAQAIIDAQGKEGAEEPKYKPVYITQNAITLRDDVQVILRFCGEPEDILKYYDFEHCKMYYTAWDSTLHITVEALEALHNKRLDYTGSAYPICSLFRMRKFMARGWTINAGQIVKAAYQISKLDLDNVNVLEDQLIGVDHAYFVQIIDALKRHQAENVGKPLDGMYLLDLIDKYF